MKVYRAIKPLTAKIDSLKKKGKVMGFVPTMGYLHEGHSSLIKKAGKDADYVVVSIFVNPTQFGPKEDFKRYPRNLKRDLELCRVNGVDMVFAPSANSMYKNGFSTYVDVENITDVLCGASRPGHFKGVATIVTKLFNIVKPDIAYFGQKDAQQAIVIKRMVEDLNMPVKIKIMPIIREKDGLAMSSRNVYLSPDERRQALALHRSLRLAKKLYRDGETDSKKIIREMKSLIFKNKDIKEDYISIVDLKNLEDLESVSQKALVATAVRIGKTRLIDNVIIGNR